MSIQKIIIAIILLAGINTAGCDYIKNLQQLQEDNARLKQMVSELKEQLAAALNDKNRLQKDLESYKAQAEEFKRKAGARKKLLEPSNFQPFQFFNNL